MPVIDTLRIDYLRLAIREGEARLLSSNQKGKSAIRQSIKNSRVRIERLQNSLAEGGQIFKNGRWMYEYENQTDDSKLELTIDRGEA